MLLIRELRDRQRVESTIEEDAIRARREPSLGPAGHRLFWSGSAPCLSFDAGMGSSVSRKCFWCFASCRDDPGGSGNSGCRTSWRCRSRNFTKRDRSEPGRRQRPCAATDGCRCVRGVSAFRFGGRTSRRASGVIYDDDSRQHRSLHGKRGSRRWTCCTDPSSVTLESDDPNRPSSTSDGFESTCCFCRLLTSGKSVQRNGQCGRSSCRLRCNRHQ
jgi:hypothetical protein